ncbi:MAG: hypothetical protein M3N08_06755 [Pseudomonadota bacterium]|nr:hypothetical protein [Pseudomonadota bacterium]
MLRRNFQQMTDGANQITLEDAFFLTNAACTEPKEHIRAFACRELGWEIWKNPRLAAPVVREILHFREDSKVSHAAVYGTLLTVMENGMGKLPPNTPLVDLAHVACFNENSEDRAVASWVIIRNLEEVHARNEPYVYAAE